MLYTVLSGHPLQVGGSHPAVHCSGPLGAEVDLADEGAAVVDQDALIEALEFDLLGGQSEADGPTAAVDVEIAIDADPPDFSSRAVLVGGRVGIVFAQARLPDRSRRTHAERLVRPHMVVLVPKLIEPTLRQPWLLAGTATSGALQGAMKPFDLALGLGMSVGGEMTSDALLHEPDQKRSPAAG